LTDLFDLVDEAVELPQRRVIRLIAAARAELVVVVVLDPSSRELAVARLEILVCTTGAAVEQQQLEIGVIADPFRPYPKGARRCTHRDHASAATQHVVPS
jgi:hypothetical protein